MNKKIITGMLWILVLCMSACGNNVEQTESSEIENIITTWQEQYDLGMQYLEDGDYEQAIVAFTAAIELDPKQAPIYIGRAQAYIGSGETEENLSAALTDYESALALDDMNPDIYLGIADVYIRQGDYEKAKEILNQALENLGENEAISEKLNELENGDIKDSDGKTHRERGFDESGNLLWYHDLNYDADGKISKEIAYNTEGAEIGQVEFLYDESGNNIQSAGYDPASGELYLVKSKFDEKRNKIQEAWYLLSDNSSEDLSPFSERTYTYDEFGKMLEEIYSYGDDVKTIKFEYDENGYEIQELTYQENQLIYRVVMQNDENGNCIREDEYFSDGTLAGYSVYERNENGYMIGVSEYDAEGNLEYTNEW